MKINKIGASVVGLGLILGVGTGLFCVEKIPAGYVGVQYSMNGGVSDEILTQGWHIISPTKKVTRYSVATEQLYMSADEREGSKTNEAFDVACSDGKMNVDFEMSYNFDSQKVPELYSRYRGLSGEDIINNIVRGKIKTYVNEVTSQYTVMDAYLTNRAKLNTDITAKLQEKLGEYGITVESATLSRTEPEEAIKVAITERSKAAQELEAEKQKKDRAEVEAERKKVEAKGEADAMLIKAQGEADANKAIQQSLTPELIQMKEIEKWNGSKATTIVGEGSTAVVTK